MGRPVSRVKCCPYGTGVSTTDFSDLGIKAESAAGGSAGRYAPAVSGGASSSMRKVRRTHQAATAAARTTARATAA